ncbi:unnamed protein product [Medioppia subpectinata]|uniref:DUF4604 domain-containing protein n=1 Tax=Medioppia subpectinata TaxID=1979941 RepID=A0A7R9KET3_9ACAR|nr:unnamed protein product [Medioppia subpectinata]CAG2101995.1 unnamed protein product [Medioppia subpectinata]
MSGRKRNIAFSRPEEPDFIKKLKARAGITAGPEIDTKKEILPKADSEDLEDRDEEQPVIVVLKDGDLTADEVKELTEENRIKDEEKDINDGKIVFKKPDKSQENSKSLAKSKNDAIIKQRLEENETKSVRNSSLLSFDDNEDEEEDYSSD